MWQVMNLIENVATSCGLTEWCWPSSLDIGPCLVVYCSRFISWSYLEASVWTMRSELVYLIISFCLLFLSSHLWTILFLRSDLILRSYVFVRLSAALTDNKFKYFCLVKSERRLLHHKERRDEGKNNTRQNGRKVKVSVYLHTSLPQSDGIFVCLCSVLPCGVHWNSSKCEHTPCYSLHLPFKASVTGFTHRAFKEHNKTQLCFLQK